VILSSERIGSDVFVGVVMVLNLSLGRGPCRCAERKIPLDV
jgi:hypothetical protein